MRAREVLVAATIFVATGSFATTARASDSTAAVARIDAVCASRSDVALQAEPAKFARVYGDPATTSSAWRTTDAALMDRIAHDPNIYSEVATVWSWGTSVAVVNVESRSLEFREDASYCFRADGSLARITDTSSGTENVDDELRYFDERGTLVAERSILAKLAGSAAGPVSPDLKAAQPLVFAHVRELPFYALLFPVPGA